MTPDQMAAIHLACFTTPRPWSAPEITDLLRSPLCFCKSAADGFLMGRVVAGECELLTIAVAPNAQGRGIGGDLMDAFLAESALRGGDMAFLEVAENNTAALRLYAAKGFVQTGMRPGYYHLQGAAPLSAVIMARNI